MNARQMKKSLKKQINRLQSDNDLMRRIIADSPKMQELYDLFVKPLNGTVATMQFQEYRSKRFLLPDLSDNEKFIELLKQRLAKELFDAIKDNITYEFDTECITPTITASIFIGRK